MSKVVIFMLGFGLTAFGISLVLTQWASVVTLFKGITGPVLAVAGLVILFASTLKNND